MIRMLGNIDFFLPYFPLDASNLRDLFAKHLGDQAEKLQQSDAANLTWAGSVLVFLRSKVGLILIFLPNRIGYHSALRATSGTISRLSYCVRC